MVWGKLMINYKFVNKSLVFVIIFLLFGLYSSVSFAQDASKVSNIYVESLSYDGNILYVGGNGPNNYSSIQGAVDDAVDGDTVFIYSGVYYENNIHVENSISIIGENTETTIIDGQGTFQYHILILYEGNSIVQSLTFRNVHSSGAGVFVWRCDGNQILDCRSINVFYAGVDIVESNNNYVSNFTCLEDGRGININGNLGSGISSGNVIENCSFPEGGRLWLWDAPDNVINNCVFNGGGIEVDSSESVSVNNTFLNCQFYNTVGLDFNSPGGNEKIINCYFDNSIISAIRVDHNHPGMEIRNCTFIDSGSQGIVFHSPIQDVVVSGCKFFNGYFGGILFCWTLRDVEVSSCHFENNPTGINMYDSNFRNSFHHNNFINNEDHILARGSGSYLRWMINSWNENYWDDYTGNFPWYHIFGFLNWDFNPASEPYDI